MTDDPMCPRCNSCPETIMHLLRDCEEASTFWNEVINPNAWSKFFSLGLFPWLEWNLSSKNDEIGKTPWSWFTFFTVSVAALWKDRNSLVFSQESKMGKELWFSIAF